MNRIRLTVRGMHCARCEERIREALKPLPGISSIRADASQDRVSFRISGTETSEARAVEAINASGYIVDESGTNQSRQPLWQTIVIFLAIIGAAILISRSGVLSRIPAIGTGLPLGLLFVVGLLTSVHCIGMCGGICLSQSVARGTGSKKFAGPGLYNLGRLISYTLVGFLVGGLGSVFSLSSRVQGLIILAAGIVMILYGLKAVGLLSFRWKLPGLSGARLAGKGPLVVGFLNGFLPCGPLQAVQLYALGTGSPWRGAAAMALFCLGTMPLMFSFGTVGAFLSARLRKRFVHIGAMVIIVMAAGMTMRGWKLTGFNPVRPEVVATTEDGFPVAVIGVDGIQRVSTLVVRSAYQPLIVQAGVPLEWTLMVGKDQLTGCNNPVTVPALGIRKTLVEGKNTITFTPDEAGLIGFTCWMGMIDSAILVVDALPEAAVRTSR